MVSPVYKQGYEMSFNSFSADGSLVFVESYGAFGGGGDQNQNTSGNGYGFSRTATGWQTLALEPPASQFAVELLDAIGEQRAVLLDGHLDGTSEYRQDLFLRGVDGSLTEVGPMLPSYAIPAEPAGANIGGVVGFPFTAASPDLSHVLFTLNEPDVGNLPLGVSHVLWPGDATKVTRPSLYEYVGTHNSVPRLVGVDDASHQISTCGTSLGSDPEHGYVSNAMSADGSTVFFTALEACEGGSGPPANEIFARVDGTRTVAISEPSAADCGACATSAPADAVFQGASLDGSKAFFSTSQALLPGDGDSTSDLYEYDATAPAAGRIVQISAGGEGDATPGTGAQVQDVAAISNDGSHVYFVAQGVLTGVANGQGQEARAGGENLYLYERDAQFPAGRTVFIATLSASDSSQWTSSLRQMSVTPDGRFLVFTSVAELTADDTSTAVQVFRYDAGTGQLARVSIGDEGFNNDGNSDLDVAYVPIPHGFGGAVLGEGGAHPAISSDGSIVVFDSSAALTPDTLADPAHTFLNAYEYRDGHVHLISDGRDRGGLPYGLPGSVVDGVSPDGQDIFVASHDALVPQDTDGIVDIYDARIDGGFPASGAVPCDGEACRASLASPPVAQTPASSLFFGPSNPKPAPARPAVRTRKRCRAHQVLRRGKCVKPARRSPKRAKQAQHRVNDHRGGVK
jgi:hypothetical protein